MSNYFYINLASAVYRVTELFPEKEPLGHQIRKSADEILVGLLCSNWKDCFVNINKISKLFDSAESRGWINPRNFLVLRREYSQIREFVQRKSKKDPSGKTVEKALTSRSRKEEILKVLKTSNKIKVGDLVRGFPALNRRTLLRDLEGFSRLGLIQKSGNGRGACYSIRNATL